ncbi:DUF1800 family protein [Rubritalea spongiae]|uniref:DUF1800 family protein n=1 Tax=Rubritalea spongiae TaxID=430797 RepID=UPI0036164E7F
MHSSSAFLPALLPSTFILFFCNALAVDTNDNGLSDVWEQLYNANSLELLEDDDGDGFKNIDECIAGTDPFDNSDHPFIKPLIVAQNTDEIELAFQTVKGKTYTLSHSNNLSEFQSINSWFGDGNERSLLIKPSGLSYSLSPIRIDFWADVLGSSIDELYSQAEFPSPPDGSISTTSIEAPRFQASGYGGRLTTFITPPQSGDYTLYLSSGGPAELYFNALSEDAVPVKIAEILESQSDIEPNQWDLYPTQRSSTLSLTANSPYLLDLRYLATVAGQHVQIAWSGPGLEGIQAIDRSALAKVPFLSETRDDSVFLEHDYDSAGQTGQLWANSAGIVNNISGLSGNAERINADLGTNAEERLNFSSGGHDHLYATWLFNMSAGAQDTYLFFQNGSINSQEGPRIDIEDNSAGTIAVVRAGGAAGNDTQIEIEFDKSYRIEIVATLSSDGFNYNTPTGNHTTLEDTFDIYVSDPEGKLIGSATGLAFRDGPGVVEALSSLRIPYPNTPNIAFDDWLFTGGLITGKGYLIPNYFDYGDEDSSHFFKLSVEESDQDGDGIPDWEEILLGTHYNLLFFDPETSNGIADNETLTNLINNSQDQPEIALQASDTAAFESNFPNTIPDDGEITITRTGSLTPLTIQLCVTALDTTGSVATVCDGTCCALIGSAGDEVAEPEDYILVDQDGKTITDSVSFAFGEMEKVLTVVAVDDSINEYPETLNLAVVPSANDSYTTSETLNGASIQLFDLPDNPDNLTIFTGTFSQDGAAAVTTNGSGYLTATLNGPRTELRIWNEFSGLTSAQQDSHLHKSSSGPNPGAIIYEITETPGDAESDPLNGPLTSYPWDIRESSGAVPTAGGAASKQTIIDSLFAQNNETPLYLNVHTVDNPAGEIWSFLGLSGGSSVEPAAPTPAAQPGSTDYPQLTGQLLEAEIRRFLNQATFGATDAEVEALTQVIEQARIDDPDYHRNEAFADWIDTQIADTDQTYLLEYTLASHYQFMTLAKLFDSTSNPSIGESTTPVKPSRWPSINRDDENPEHWYLDDVYPVDRADFNLAGTNNLRTEPNYVQRRQAHWQLMINAHDQLRQKMGYALQQIVVVSDSLTSIRDTPYGSANYQDMLNTYAFEHYRDVLGFVNWSPVMGKWLSSLQNQKAIDFDGDGFYDAYPDENLARENMQLFSIGLFETWPDGSLKLSSEGLPKACYTNDDIREFAKILTGQSFSRHNGYFDRWGGNPFSADNTNFGANQRSFGVLGLAYLYPMKMFGEYHSPGPKSFAGTTIDNTSIIDPTQRGIADIEAAIDWLAGKPDDGKPDYDMTNSHVSTPAFISRRLIQRFTTSNPSKDYLHRVASVFKESEGDLGLTVRAILLDPEARKLDLEDTTFGLKKSPLEGYLQLLRSLEAHTYTPITNPANAAPYDEAPGDFSNPELYLDSFGYPSDQIDNHTRNVRFMPPSALTSAGSRGLQMNPFSQVTVFNYYLPDYSPSGVINNAELVSPEMQLANEPDIIRNINYFEDIIRSTYGPFGDELGGTDANQIAAFGGVAEAVNNDAQQLSRQALADAFYPATEPADALTTIADGSTETINGSSVSPPYWLRLQRIGDTFITSDSVDGVNWNVISTQVLPMASEAYVGLAVTSHDDGIHTTAQFSNITLSGGVSDWQFQDIGSVSATGSTNMTAADAMTIQASGNDIWSSNDEFHFAYQWLDGDGEIIARVDSLLETHPWAKAGLMIRETLASNSANVMTLMSASYGTRSQIRRVSRGRSSESLADEALLDALDLRLTNGLFKMRYPYDPSDDDDPNIHGLDDWLKNPRELIIDAITNAYGDPYDTSNDESDRLNKLSDALYLLTFSPEYQIKK